ncbi:MAG: amidohydrolase family protein [Gemmatimonadetes bacterium]|nr:amidohydrolase family protein [Gemmatimonadota bacterium]
MRFQCTLAAVAVAFAVPVAPLAAQVIAIEGGTVYTMAGPPIENGTVLIRDGKILAVGVGISVPNGARRIDARGKIVTPGLFESSTHIGLAEVDAVETTNDFVAQGPAGTATSDLITAAFNVADGINPASMVIPVTRISGVTTTVTRPEGGLVAGQGVVIDLAGSRLDDMLVKSPAAMFASLGDASRVAGGGARAGATLRLREVLDDAKQYAARRTAFERNETRDFAESRLDLEALIPVVEGRLPIAVEAHRASDIRTVLRIADEYRLKLILLGATEGWMVAGDIASARVPVVVKALDDLPASFERLGARLENAALLRAAGVLVAITTNTTHDARNLKQEAGNAVANGLPYEEALRAITLYPAQIWGVADTHGSLEAGKVADVVVWDGDPLELLTRVNAVIIGGRPIPLVSRQTELRDRYRDPAAARRAYGADAAP